MLAKLYRKISPFKEPILWSAALVILYTIYPVSPQDFSFCLLSMLGWENCWGCGIGKSMSCAMHGQIQESLNYHFMGIFALPLLASRIALLTYKNLRPKIITNQNKNHE